jgi:hypothetical protein
VLVHRLLLAAVAATDWWAGKDRQEEPLLGNTDLAEVATSSLLPSLPPQLCSHINTRNRAAQRAQRDSQTLFQTLYFRHR